MTVTGQGKRLFAGDIKGYKRQRCSQARETKVLWLVQSRAKYAKSRAANVKEDASIKRHREMLQ